MATSFGLINTRITLFYFKKLNLHVLFELICDKLSR